MNGPQNVDQLFVFLASILFVHFILIETFLFLYVVVDLLERVVENGLVHVEPLVELLVDFHFLVLIHEVIRVLALDSHLDFEFAPIGFVLA